MYAVGIEAVPMAPRGKARTGASRCPGSCKHLLGARVTKQYPSAARQEQLLERHASNIGALQHRSHEFLGWNVAMAGNVVGDAFRSDEDTAAVGDKDVLN